jgi:predicted secreted protein
VSTGGPDVTVSSQSEDCRIITATVGKSFTIHLWEDRTRGEQWVPEFDTKAVTLLADDFLQIASNNAVENGQRTFELEAVSPGIHRVVFEKRLGWKFTAEDRRVFQIEVTDGTRS